MPEHNDASIDPAVLDGVASEFFDSGNSNLLDRWQPHHNWRELRSSANLDPYCRYTTEATGPTTCAIDRAGRKLSGVNFASQDYLSFSRAPAIQEAAIAAISQFGVHSAGSAALMGMSVPAIELENALSDFVGLSDTTLFPTGWGAGYGVIKTLVTPGDHILIDVLAHACLQEGARNATRNVHSFPHASTEAVERRLKRIREKGVHTGIMVVTETVFSMDSDVPDLAALQELCRKFNATLLVDMAHDLGCIGPTGRGYLEIQGMLGKVDLLMGSFSKTFASNGGFVSTNHPALKLALRGNCGPSTFSNALSPVQASIVLKSLEIIRSTEGDQRRECLMGNILYMRQRLSEAGFELLGQPSAIIPVILGGNALSRLITRFTLECGGLVNMVEYPAVSKNSCRWRLQVMADHTHEHIDRFVEIAVAARKKAQEVLALQCSGTAA